MPYTLQCRSVDVTVNHCKSVFTYFRCTVNFWYKKVHFFFLQSRVFWFKKDLCGEPKNRSSEKNALCRWICNLRSFLNWEFTVLGLVIKCIQYSGITVKSGTPVKSVHITLNIFAVLIYLAKFLCKFHNLLGIFTYFIASF